MIMPKQVKSTRPRHQRHAQNAQEHPKTANAKSGQAEDKSFSSGKTASFPLGYFTQMHSKVALTDFRNSQRALCASVLPKRKSRANRSFTTVFKMYLTSIIRAAPPHWPLCGKRMAVWSSSHIPSCRLIKQQCD